MAIYENGTVFNGHYAAQEKVSLVKFNLSDSGDNTPFVSGDNVIVTPTSLFTSTLLNAKLQHQQQDETPLNGAGFGSVDRDEGANSDGATDEVNFFYDAGELTSEEAMDLLNQILEFVAGDDGNYSATYSFESDAIGSLPSGWTNSSTNGTITEVIEEKDGHNTVLQLTDNLIGCENRTNVYTSFASQTYGTIEGWLYVDEGSARVSLGDSDNIILTFNNTGLYCTNNTSTVLASAGDYANEWHHYKVEFECGTENHYNLTQGEYRVYLDNGILWVFKNQEYYL